MAEVEHVGVGAEHGGENVGVAAQAAQVAGRQRPAGFEDARALGPLAETVVIEVDDDARPVAADGGVACRSWWAATRATNASARRCSGLRTSRWCRVARRSSSRWPSMSLRRPAASAWGRQACRCVEPSSVHQLTERRWRARRACASRRQASDETAAGATSASTSAATVVSCSAVRPAARATKAVSAAARWASVRKGSSPLGGAAGR